MKVKAKAKTCSRCAGTGQTPFHWVLNGVCFKCGGVGVVTQKTIINSLADEVEIHAKDVEDWTSELEHNKKKCIRKSSKTIERTTCCRFKH